MSAHEPTPGLTNVSFTCAYWDFLRGHRPAAPNPMDHGLIPSQGLVLTLSCDTEFAALKSKEVKS